MSKESTVDRQKAMCHNGFITSTQNKLSELIAERRRERHELVKEWRENGQTDELWAIVEEHDRVSDIQESALDTLESHRIGA